MFGRMTEKPMQSVIFKLIKGKYDKRLKTHQHFEIGS